MLNTFFNLKYIGQILTEPVGDGMVEYYRQLVYVSFRFRSSREPRELDIPEEGDGAA